MQSIERYGVVALLFLVVTVIAVLVWDTDAVPVSPGETVAQAAEREAGDSRRVTMKAPAIRRGPRSSGKGLTQDLVEEQRNAAHDQVIAQEAALATLPSETLPTQAELPVEMPLRTGGIVPADGQDSRSMAFDEEREPVRDLAGERARAAEVSATPLERPETRAYRIQSGDTLSEIAMNELGTLKRWEEIAALNPNLDPAKLIVGKEIRLPLGGSTDSAASAQRAPETSAKPEPASVAEGPTYRVVEGDSLWKIAQRMLGDGNRWSEIAGLNPKIDPDRLRAGQELVLPEGATAPAPRIADATPTESAPRRGRVQ